MRNTKGQAAAAAALLAIIAGLITLYILFIPPDEREKIIGASDSSALGRGTSLVRNTTLLTQNPGRIDFLSQKHIDHAIPTTHIFTRTSGMVLDEKNSLTAQRSLFSSVDALMEFTITDISNVDHVLLSFTPAQARGVLTITLNDEEIARRTITDGEPITLPSKLLKSANKLHFSVSSPGVAFWRTNIYELVDVKVTGDVTRVDAQKSKNVFLVPPVEYNNLERVRLKFQPDCDEDFAGPLDVWVNSHSIYSAIPDCGVGVLGIEFPESYINLGENTLTFAIERGDYDISHISLASELKQIDFPVYFFELSEEQYKSIRNGTKRIVARLDFVDGLEKKQGELIVNGHTTGFDTRDVLFEADVSRDIVRGNNGLKIKPEKTVDIRELKVVLAK